MAEITRVIAYVCEGGARGSAKVCVELRTEFPGIAEPDQFYIGARTESLI